jgi:hypothetical protein
MVGPAISEPNQIARLDKKVFAAVLLHRTR